MSERLVVIGDTLLDRDVEGRSERLCPDAPAPVVDQLGNRSRPGGAGLAAALAATARAPVTLVAALGRDPAGDELRRLLVGAGVDLVDLGLCGATPEKIRILDNGRPLLRLDRGGGQVSTAPSAAIEHALDGAGAVLVSDYGQGLVAHPEVRGALASRVAAVPIVWDPHPRGSSPLPGTTVATPNLEEAARIARRPAVLDDDGIAGLAIELVAVWDVGAVCVTCGGDGAMLALAGDDVFRYSVDPARGDPCGAGDCFAAELASVLARGGGCEQGVTAAVAAAAEFVSAGGARGIAPADPRTAILAAGEQGLGDAPLSIEPALRLCARVRERGGTVVAAGGCFDLLHAGHLQTLEAARQLGDCLVVLLNGDRSVERLKGPSRPVVGELERAEILKALRCVDEVAIFDEPTPIEALRLLRPDVWVKGGDYSTKDLPEQEAVRAWGGRTAIVPHLDGRSTTNLIEKAGQHG